MVWTPKSPDFEPKSGNFKLHWNKFYEPAIQSRLGSSFAAHPPAKGTVYAASCHAVGEYWTAYPCPADHEEIYRFSAGRPSFANAYDHGPDIYRCCFNSASDCRQCDVSG